MSRRWLQCATIVAALVAAEDRAHAAVTARLAWSRLDDADSCIEGRALERRVARRLGSDPFVATDAPSVVAEGAVRREAGRWRVDLTFRDAAGHRTGSRQLTSTEPTCGGVTEATVLALALAIDPEAALRPPTSLEEGPPEGSAPATPAARAAHEAPSPPPASAVTSRVEASGLVASGVLPGASAGAGIGFSVALSGAWRVGLRGVVFPEARTDDGAFGFGISSAVVSGELRVLRLGALSLAATAGAWGGIFHTYVHPFPGLAAVAPGDYGWAALDAGPALGLEVWPGFDLALAGRALVPLTRTRALIRGGGLAFEQPAVGFTGELTAGLRF